MKRGTLIQGKGLAAPEARRLVVDFLYLDLTTCDRCLGTEANLATAMELLRPVLEATGLDVTVRKLLVDSEEEARRWRLLSSPTIRVDGRDVAPGHSESLCGPCSDICGEDTLCRVWAYAGEDYTAAPVGLIIDSVLAALYAGQGGDAGGNEGEGSYRLPENLASFFARGQGTLEAAACCSPGACTPAAASAASGSACEPNSGGCDCG